jgi:hypothetical protein
MKISDLLWQNKPMPRQQQKQRWLSQGWRGLDGDSLAWLGVLDGGLTGKNVTPVMPIA